MTAAGIALIAGGLAILVGFRHLLWGKDDERGPGERRRPRPPHAIEAPGERRRPRAPRAIEASRRKALSATASAPPVDDEPESAAVPGPRRPRRRALVAATPVEAMPAGPVAVQEPRDAGPLTGESPDEDDVDVELGEVRRRRRPRGGLARIGLADDDDEMSGDVLADHGDELSGDVLADRGDELAGDVLADRGDELSGDVLADHGEEMSGEVFADDETAVAWDVDDFEVEVQPELASAADRADVPEPVHDDATDHDAFDHHAVGGDGGDEADRHEIRAEAGGEPDEEDDEAAAGPVAGPPRRGERLGDRVAGWVRPEYQEQPEPGEYWTPVPESSYADAGYGWPVPVERLPAVPPQPPRSGFDLDPLEEAEPTAVVPQWPPAKPSGRIELPRSWAVRNTKGRRPAEPGDEEVRAPRRSAVMIRRGRAAGSTETLPAVGDSTQTLPAVDDREPEPQRRRPRPRPNQPDPRSTVYRSRHAADPS